MVHLPIADILLTESKKGELECGVAGQNWGGRAAVSGPGVGAASVGTVKVPL